MATQLLRVVTGFYIVVVICSLIGQMIVEYRHEKQSIRKEFVNIQTTFENVLAGQIWNLDEQGLRSTVAGIIELPMIVGVRISDERGAPIAIGGIVKNGSGTGETGPHVHLPGLPLKDDAVRIDDTYRFEMFEGSFPIIYSVNQESRVLGKATLYSNSSVIFDRMKVTILMSGIQAVIEMGLLWMIFSLVFVRLLKKPLAELTDAVKNVTLDNLEPIKVSALSGNRNELRVLEESFNQMLLNLRNEIGKRKIADASLTVTEDKLNSILRVAPAGIGLLKGRVIEAVNPAMCDLTGYSRDELIGQSSRLLYPTDEEFQRSGNRLHALIARNGMGMIEVLWIRKDGRHLNVLLSEASLIPADPEGEITFIAMDLTERKLSEEREILLRLRLEKAARMESLGLLAGGVAHDLNNVLGPILALPEMVADYIKRYGNPSDPDHDFSLKAVKTIENMAERAAAMVSDLVVMGRRGQFQASPVDVNKVVEQALSSRQIKDIQIRRPDIQILKQMSADQLWCMGSDSRLMRILSNLVGNASDAITAQGSILVRTGRQVLTEPKQGYEEVPAGDYITIEVIDTGCGIDAITLARIFEPFYSTKTPGERSGSGLGLSVVKGLVQDHSGFLDVQSVPGKGTTFTIYLPFVPAADIAGGTDDSPLPGGNERILIVDDEPGQQFLAQWALKKLGYDVIAVPSGDAAVALLKSAGKVSPVDLVMMDMIMKGMDGLATSKAILGMFPKHKILIASGHAPDNLVAEVKTLGIDWLHKPYTLLALARTLRDRLDR